MQDRVSSAVHSRACVLNLVASRLRFDILTEVGPPYKKIDACFKFRNWRGYLKSLMSSTRNKIGEHVLVLWNFPFSVKFILRNIFLKIFFLNQI